MRTGTECQQSEREPVREKDCSFVINKASNAGMSAKPKTLSDFTQTKDEEIALTELHEELNAYMVQKHAIRIQNPDKVFLNVQDYLELTRATGQR